MFTFSRLAIFKELLDFRFMCLLLVCSGVLLNLVFIDRVDPWLSLLVNGLLFIGIFLFFKNLKLHYVSFLALTFLSLVSGELYYRVSIFGLEGLNFLKVHKWNVNSIFSDAQLDTSSERVYVPSSTFHLMGKKVLINKDGFVDVRLDRSYKAKKENEFRIVLLGASIAFGWGVEGKYTYPRLLEESLNEGNPAGKDIVVLNLSFPGKTAANHFYEMDTSLSELNPDLILFNVGLDQDFFADTFYHADEDEVGPYVVTREIVPLWEYLVFKKYYYILNQFYFPPLFSRQMRSRLAAFDTIKKLLGKSKKSGRDFYGSPAQIRYVQWLIEELKQRKGRFPMLLFALKPVTMINEDNPIQEVRDTLKDGLKSMNLTLIDLYELPLDEPMLDLMITYDDLHPNARMHRWYARHLADGVRSYLKEHRQ